MNEEGRFTADGIQFDTNSDRIRPEFEAVLKEIAELMAAHAHLKIGIEGHTDNTGGMQRTTPFPKRGRVR